MAVFKCTMCGGSLEVTENTKICVCEYCGVSQTLPKNDDDKKINALNRANALRMENKFDKAAMMYDSIVTEFTNELEAYWGLVLCTYGIEYVDDPATGRKVPTCHRSSYVSIYDDPNYDMIKELANGEQKQIYKEKAAEIEKIRERIIQISEKEEPYDIFICFKDKDDNGSRTRDSCRAEQVYDLLTEKKYRVFFSRITLEDKIGEEYEPLIFAALNSAKIMLVFGSCEEYFNAVWVKNEWSRFLKLMEQDKTKKLYPCLLSVNPSEMPKEFQALQAKDLDEPGSEVDLFKAVKKILPKESEPKPVTQIIYREGVYNGAEAINKYVRTALQFTADRKFGDAERSLLDCERVDGNAVGSLIAKATFSFVSALTPGVCDPHKQKEMFSNVQRNYSALASRGNDISNEEKEMYAAMESSDIYATLLMVFDALNDKKRVAYIEELINPNEVYNFACNSTLLKYYIKNSRTNEIDIIVSNTDNIDVTATFHELINKYPSSPTKAASIGKLLKAGALKPEDRPVIEDYLQLSADSADVKCGIASSALIAGIRVRTDTAVKYLFEKNGVTETDILRVFKAFCHEKLTDEELLDLVYYIFGNCSKDGILGALDICRTTDQYLYISLTGLYNVFKNKLMSVDDKTEIFSRLFEFNINEKEFGNLTADYLCSQSDDENERSRFLYYLISKSPTIPAQSIENYILHTDFDADKDKVIAEIFKKDINRGYLNDIIAKYIESNCGDSDEMKIKVVSTIMQAGLKLDANGVNKLVCSRRLNKGTKHQLTKLAIDNGTHPRSDAANEYLHFAANDTFDSAMFAMLMPCAGSFNPETIAKYSIVLDEAAETKRNNLRKMLQISPSSATQAHCSVKHLGHTVECNILQAYVLSTDDPASVAFEITDMFLNGEKIKFNAEVLVDGMPMKFKKYVAANRGSLTTLTDTILERYKVYSMIF